MALPGVMANFDRTVPGFKMTFSRRKYNIFPVINYGIIFGCIMAQSKNCFFFCLYTKQYFPEFLNSKLSHGFQIESIVHCDRNVSDTNVQHDSEIASATAAAEDDAARNCEDLIQHCDSECLYLVQFECCS